MELNTNYEEKSSGNGYDIAYTLIFKSDGKCTLDIEYTSAETLHENYSGTYTLSSDKQTGSIHFTKLVKCDDNTCEQLNTNITVNVKVDYGKVRFQSGNKIISHHSFLY
jgi:hypothetical protein